MYTRTVLLTLLVAIFNTSVLSQRDCSVVLCPRPLCTNPTLKSGECCPTCEDSNCKFKGCVNFNVSVDSRTQWAPQPCLICQCDVEQNQPLCAAIDCGPPPTEAECLGYPVVTKPNKCCAECDFGVPDDTCQLVPQVSLRAGGTQEIQITATRGRQSCSSLVISQTCDKAAFRSAGGKRFRCEPVEGKKMVTFDPSCPISRATYTDVTRCRTVEDSTLFVGCDLVVD